MNDEELRQRLVNVQALAESALKATAVHQLLVIRMLSEQQAHLAALRNLMVRMGEDRTMLNQRLRAAFETALFQYHEQIEAYQQSGDAIKFVTSLVFPDDTQSN